MIVVHAYPATALGRKANESLIGGYLCGDNLDRSRNLCDSESEGKRCCFGVRKV